MGITEDDFFGWFFIKKYLDLASLVVLEIVHTRWHVPIRSKSDYVTMVATKGAQSDGSEGEATGRTQLEPYFSSIQFTNVRTMVRHILGRYHQDLEDAFTHP
jgi:hypothetical protein